jgi:hypothetical protein
MHGLFFYVYICTDFLSLLLKDIMRNDVKIVFMLEDPCMNTPIKDSKIKTSAQMQTLLNTWITTGLLIKSDESVLPNGLVRHRIIKCKEQGEA